jgi:hypothetical protein
MYYDRRRLPFRYVILAVIGVVVVAHLGLLTSATRAVRSLADEPVDMVPMAVMGSLPLRTTASISHSMSSISPTVRPSAIEVFRKERRLPRHDQVGIRLDLFKPKPDGDGTDVLTLETNMSPVQAREMARRLIEVADTVEADRQIQQINQEP